MVLAERLLTALVDTTEGALYALELDGTISHWNRAAERLYGWSAEEANGKPAELLVPTDRRDELRAIVERLFRGERTAPIDTVRVRKDGTRVDVRCRFARVDDDDGVLEGILVVVRPTEDRLRRTLADLRASERRQRRLLETTTMGVWLLDANDLTSFVNRRMAEMIGYAPEELLGKPPHVFGAEESKDAGVQSLERRRAGLSEQMELVLVRRDGTKLQTIFEMNPLFDANGNYEGALALVADVTERRAAEEALRISDQALRQAQKMEAVGRLAGGVAHDFNNILCVIASYADYLLEELQPGEPRDAVEEIRRAGERAAGLTAQLLAFSRKQVLKPTAVDVRAVFDGLDKMLHRILGEDIALSFGVSGSPCVFVDRGQLEQVLVNLAVNARDAMRDCGTLEIEASEEDDRVLIAVTDTGCGMTPEVRARIFEPFFTTKGLGKGTGLGLATVFGIVKQSGGAIACASEVGEGTRFEIRLPRHDGTAETNDAERPVARDHHGGETILLVEDDDEVRAITRTLLRRSGYLVIDAANPLDALCASDAHGGPIHLLLTDVVMPLMNGRELAESFAKRHPNARVLYMSGYTDDEVLLRGVRAESAAFLQKPFTPAALLDQVVTRLRA